MTRSLLFAALALSAAAPFCRAEDPPAAISTPSITGPLTAPRPNSIGGETLPGLTVNGVISGMGIGQSNHVPGDQPSQAALSNGQIFLQKTSGWWQFYVQAGAYNLPSLGLPFLSTEDTLSDLYSPVPVAYLKLVPAKNTSVVIGSLPAPFGAESTFTFQNMNIERGLLWNQENSISRGVQVNQTIGKITATVGWTDGFYSNRYSWLNGSLTWTSGPHSVSLQAMGNLGQTAFRTLATPVQNNGSMYAAIYSYAKGAWIVQPYFQYTDVPANVRAGVDSGASTRGGALLVSRSFGRGFALAGRAEYLASAGALNLLYGPGSAAWSATLTPTFQRDRVFVRGDLAIVRARGETAGYAFGSAGADRSQTRAVVEAGILF